MALVLIFSACKDQDLMNIDPNKPTQTHPQLLLTQVEWNAFQDFGGTGPLYATRMLVQTDGESEGQYFKWARGSFGAYSSMRNVSKMMEEAARINDPSYIALAKFLRAYYFYNLTLTFGDVPYSEALKGEAGTPNYAPAYDTQEMVFKGILKELDEANTSLKGLNTIIAGDIIYKGDVSKWRKLINAFRLKVLITLSKKENAPDFNIKQTFAQIVQNEPLMTSNNDNGQLVFLDQQGNRYPEFNSSSFGSGMYMSSTFIQHLKDREDARLFTFCTQTKIGKEAGKAIDDFTSYDGGDPAAPYAETNIKATEGKVSKVNDRFTKNPTNEPRMVLGYAEQELILAEAIVRGWISGDANTHYNNGVKASFKFYETYVSSSASYLTEAKTNAYLALPANNFSLATSFDQKMAQIITQKYLATFFQGGWSAFRDNLRTGYPEFSRPTGVSVPYRWIYPQSEYDNNRDNVSKAIASQFGAGNDKINQIVWWLK